MCLLNLDWFPHLPRGIKFCFFRVDNSKISSEFREKQLKQIKTLDQLGLGCDTCTTICIKLIFIMTCNEWYAREK